MTMITQTLPQSNHGGLYALFADIESEFIINRKRLLQGGLNAFNGNILDWQKQTIAQIPTLRQMNVDTLSRRKEKIAAAIVGSMKAAYQNGTTKSQKLIERYAREGFDIPNITATITTSAALTAAIVKMFGEIQKAEQMAVAMAERQFFDIANKAAARYDGNLAKNIDMSSYEELEKGLVGHVSANNRLANIATLADGIERNNTHRALLTGEGERAGLSGQHHVRITAHARSCPLCYKWQNVVVINDVFDNGKPDGHTPLISTAIDEGFLHYNCMHEYNFEPPGGRLSFERDVQPKEENDANYQNMQRQRYNEEMIRSWKRREDGALTEPERLKAANHVSAWQARQRALIADSNKQGLPLYRQYTREQLGGETLPLRRVP